MNQSKEQVRSALNSAVSQGIISSQSQSAIISHLDDIGIAGCQGVDVDDIDSEEVTLVTLMIDASGSMLRYQQEVLESYQKDLLDELKKSKNAQSILMSVWVFSRVAGQPNVRLIHGYTPIPDCRALTPADYTPDGETPLNDAAFAGLTGLLDYGQTLRDNGTRTKSVAVLLSDGWENASKISASKVRNLAEELLAVQEFVLAYAFFYDKKRMSKDQGKQAGDEAARAIGFPVHHRITDELDGSGLRRLFGQVSASVISASQSKVSSTSLSSTPFFGNP